VVDEVEEEEGAPGPEEEGGVEVPLPRRLIRN